jgi:hypothetical protein
MHCLFSDPFAIVAGADLQTGPGTNHPRKLRPDRGFRRSSCINGSNAAAEFDFINQQVMEYLKELRVRGIPRRNLDAADSQSENSKQWGTLEVAEFESFPVEDFRLELCSRSAWRSHRRTK